MIAMKEPHVKIVAHKKDGTLVKGYTDGIPEFYAKSLTNEHPNSPPERLKLRMVESQKDVEVRLDGLKALFFVKSFEGSRAYNEIKFFKAHPLLEGLWVRLKYSDGEGTEGVVYNSIDFVTNVGFYLKPPDPHSNNQIVYVLKNSLKDFRVLGVRGTY